MKEQSTAYILIKVEPWGIESVTLGANTEDEEAISVELLKLCRPIIRQLDQVVNRKFELLSQIERVNGEGVNHE